jgi:hypothetical protein
MMISIVWYGYFVGVMCSPFPRFDYVAGSSQKDDQCRDGSNVTPIAVEPVCCGLLFCLQEYFSKIAS